MLSANYRLYCTNVWIFSDHQAPHLFDPFAHGLLVGPPSSHNFVFSRNCLRPNMKLTHLGLLALANSVYADGLFSRLRGGLHRGVTADTLPFEGFDKRALLAERHLGTGENTGECAESAIKGPENDGVRCSQQCWFKQDGLWISACGNTTWCHQVPGITNSANVCCTQNIVSYNNTCANNTQTCCILSPSEPPSEPPSLTPTAEPT